MRRSAPFLPELGEEVAVLVTPASLYVRRERCERLTTLFEGATAFLPLLNLEVPILAIERKECELSKRKISALKGVRKSIPGLAGEL